MPYWLGNAAKTTIMQRISALAIRPLIVIDLGCGDGGDWPRFLADHPNVTLHAHDPDAERAAVARKRLQPWSTDVHAGPRATTITERADVIVSFSVFEHVWDRLGFLHDARSLLAADGIFFLNYDDGHFRRSLPLDLPGRWASELRTTVNNALAPVWAKRALFDRYQKRVHRDEVDDMTARAGFRCDEAFYSNLADLKELFSVIPPEGQQAYVEMWTKLEARLNNEFAVPVDGVRGDSMNLWRVMPSRTLVLRHAGGSQKA